MTATAVTAPADQALVQLESNPAPGPGARTGRTAGQVGTVVVFLDLVFAFGWLGSGSWTERQVLAVTAVSYVLTSAAHNLVNWWRSERRRPVEAVTVTAAPQVTPTDRGGTG